MLKRYVFALTGAEACRWARKPGGQFDSGLILEPLISSIWYRAQTSESPGVLCREWLAVTGPRDSHYLLWLTRCVNTLLRRRSWCNFRNGTY